MADRARVLLADDEVHFQQAVAELLREEGFYCDPVGDAYAALSLLEASDYDVLIADIKMPGNLNLEFVRQVAEQAPRISVILVTGYPSTETAIESVQLPVIAYLVKPFKFETLLHHVRFGVERRTAFRALERLRQQVHSFDQALTVTEGAMEQASQQTFSDPLGAFVEYVYHHILTSLGELKKVTGMLVDPVESRPVLPFPDPRIEVLKDALEDVVAVLVKTKTAFKSKDLGQLRRRMETLLEQMRTPSGKTGLKAVAPDPGGS